MRTTFTPIVGAGGHKHIPIQGMKGKGIKVKENAASEAARATR
jgi:hypothetical protein